MGEYNFVLKDALKCIELDPEFYKGYLRASSGYFELGQYEMALNMLEKSKKINIEKDLMEMKENIIAKMQEEKFNSESKFINLKF